MGFYIFQHPVTQEVKEVFQHMNDQHVYFEDNIEWIRIFTIPNASIDVKIDPYSKKDFVEKTRTKKGTLGSIWDQSKELSEKRKGNSSIDPVQDKYLADYKKKVGKPHIVEAKRKNQEKLKKMGVSLE